MPLMNKDSRATPCAGRADLRAAAMDSWLRNEGRACTLVIGVPRSQEVPTGRGAGTLAARFFPCPSPGAVEADRGDHGPRCVIWSARDPEITPFFERRQANAVPRAPSPSPRPPLPPGMNYTRDLQ